MPQRPSILLVMSDQHHAGVMGCAGDPVAHTPSLDRLARQGVRFSSAYCPFPLCGPSRMSFMASRHPHELGLWDNESQLDGDVPTLAHAFLAAGYDTVLSGRMHFVGWDQRHGFAERLIGDVPESAYLAAGWQLRQVLGDLVDTPGMSLTGVLKSGPGRTGYHAYDEAVTRTTVDWLRQRGRGGGDRPFLLTVGYGAPHCPFVAPPADFERYHRAIASADLPPHPAADQLHPVNAERRRRFGTDPAPPLDAQWRARVAYYGLCTFLDRQVGQVLTALEQSGLAGNTIVVYCSDHGEMLGEHGMWWKSTFYDGASRVPLLVSWPGRIAAGPSSARNVSLVDVGTTLIDLAGLDALPGASGRSLRPMIEGDDTGWEDTALAEYAERGSPAVSRMVRSGLWKYNYYHGQEPELFHLGDDAGETRNRAGQPEHRDLEQRLRELVLRDWRPDHIGQYMERRNRELALIGHWVKTTRPPEPDPLWFADPPENWVDRDVSPPDLPDPASGGVP
ncbi:MAG: sulfatase-like hydrolase/transferase [Gemmatimonadota bacterium]